MADSLRMAMKVRLSVILSADEAFHNLIMFAFVALHLFSSGTRHLSDITNILQLIERLDEIHTKV